MLTLVDGASVSKRIKLVVEHIVYMLSTLNLNVETTLKMQNTVNVNRLSDFSVDTTNSTL